MIINIDSSMPVDIKALVLEHNHANNQVLYYDGKLQRQHMKMYFQRWTNSREYYKKYANDLRTELLLKGYS